MNSQVFVRLLSPTPLLRGEGEGEIPAGVLPRVALLRRLPWATIRSSLRDFSLLAKERGKSLGGVLTQGGIRASFALGWYAKPASGFSRWLAIKSRGVAQRKLRGL